MGLLVRRYLSRTPCSVCFEDSDETWWRERRLCISRVGPMLLQTEFYRKDAAFREESLPLTAIPGPFGQRYYFTGKSEQVRCAPHAEIWSLIEGM